MDNSPQKSSKTIWILWLFSFSLCFFHFAVCLALTNMAFQPLVESLDACQREVDSLCEEVSGWREKDEAFFNECNEKLNALEKEPEVTSSTTSSIPYEDYILDVCAKYPEVEPSLVEAVIYTESQFNPKASHPADSCVGLMQVSTKWHTKRAKNLGVEDLYDPYGNILTGVDILNQLLSESDNDLAWALTVYNAGYDVANSCRRSGDVWPYAKDVIDLWEFLKMGGELYGTE